MARSLFAVAERRIQGVQDLIQSLLDSDIPYENIRHALQTKREEFKLIEAELYETAETGNSDLLVAFVNSTLLSANDALRPLGTIERACNYDAAFEIQAPLLRLIRRCLNADSAKLILFYEWLASPHTVLYPNEQGAEFVWVGMPITESKNPLVIPLAAHELAHNIWRVRDDEANRLKVSVLTSLTALLNGKYKQQIKDLFDIDDAEAVLRQSNFFTTPLAPILNNAYRQIEEVFCDQFGLCIFGRSYLLAFRHLLEPNAGPRSPIYPTNQQRISYQLYAAQQLGVVVPDDYSDSFAPSESPYSDRDQLRLDIADEAVAQIAPDAFKIARSIANEGGEACDSWNSEQAKEYEFFKRGLPALKSRSLATIVDAAWRRYEEILSHEKTTEASDQSTSQKSFEQKLKQTNNLFEITLKTLEVFELEQIQKEVKVA